MPNLRPQKPSHARHIIALLLITAVLGVAVGVHAYTKRYAGKIYPGVHVVGADLGGKGAEEARKILQQKTDAYMRKGIVFVSGGKEIVINPTVIAPEDPDLYYELISFDLDKTIMAAMAVGREKNPLVRWYDFALAQVQGRDIPLTYNLNREALRKALRENFDALADPPQNARPLVQFRDNGVSVTVLPEKAGTVFDYEAAIENVRTNLPRLRSATLAISQKEVEPDVRADEVSNLLPEIQKLFARADLLLQFEDRSWTVSQKTLASWLGFVRSENAVRVGLDEEAVAAFIEPIASEINVAPKNAKFVIDDNRVTEFLASENGRILPIPANIRVIEAAVLGNAESATLIVEEAEPQQKTGEVNTLGIRERIGFGKTSFAGSPKNRRHNIQIAVQHLNGLIISQGATFSLVEAIGNVDADAGYREELVIKGDRTIPEFGGGLCQIATTFFRVALDAGLPILERQNHSYRVPYYEPPIGIDATIYLPKPDLKIMNDTPGAILIQARIEGNALIFELWGTKDGRVAERTDPVVTNIVQPPPPKTIETEDLPVGVKKCTERAHAGADASFTYTVTYADGRKEAKIFRSHYRPWQEVCAIGVPPGTLQNATSTPTGT
ncbi:MAG: VanW family protein [Patescibacteria group bacterium]